MLVMEYDAAKGGWGEPEIVPYDDFRINPACCSLHYGQGIFEGLKAYKNSKGEITMFRPRDNFVRMNRSAERLCMAQLDIDTVIAALSELVKLEEEWIPTAPGTALYIRPRCSPQQKVCFHHHSFACGQLLRTRTSTHKTHRRERAHPRVQGRYGRSKMHGQLCMQPACRRKSQRKRLRPGSVA